MPDDRNDDTLALVLAQTRRFAARELDAARLERLEVPPPELLAAAGEAGLFGLTVPERYGGLDLTLGQTCEVVAELAVADRAFATTVGLHSGLGVRGLVELASEELAARWLPGIASGEHVAGFCATEPGAGSDLAAVRTTARLDEDGQALILDGEKSYVTNGGIAHVLTVLARTPGLGGGRATSLLCVPTDLPGVEIGREEDKLGIRGSSTTTVRFEKVRLPRDHVLGEPGSGLDHAHHLLIWGRTIMAAGCLGTARAALDAATAHVTTRKQFRRPIGEFEATRAHVARMAWTVRAMEALVRQVGIAHARGEDTTGISAVAKVFCSEGAYDACDTSVQLHGALGFLEDTGVPRLLRDCRVTRIFEGANDVLLIRLGTTLAAAPHTLDEAMPCKSPTLLKEACERWREVRARLGSELEQARKRFGVGVVRRQNVLQRLARAHVCLLAAAATLAYETEREDRDADMTQLATFALAAEAERQLDSIATVERDGALAHAVTERLFGTEPEAAKPKSSQPPRPEVAG